MTNWKVKEKGGDEREWPKETKEEVEDALKDFEWMELEVETPTGDILSREEFMQEYSGPEAGSNEDIDNRTDDDVEVIDTTDEELAEAYQEKDKADEEIAEGANTVPDVKETQDALDQLGESLETDPLSILPGHMIDNIKGQPAINKRGYAMIAERYGVEVKSEMVSFPWENDENRAVAKAVAKTEDGKEYQDYGTAREGDGDMKEQLVELASTRALKRVTGWATGLGIVSYQELSQELEGAQ